MLLSRSETIPNPNNNGFDAVKGHNLVIIGTSNPDGTITPLPSTSPLYQMFSGAISTNQTIQDNREAAPHSPCNTRC